jgi:hydroxymethylpyrimidine/phosphomethylpyrimidine kinase
MSSHIQPVALTIAGSDSGGGAGIQTDLKAFHQLGVFGTSAITAVTAQNPLGVRSVQPIDVAIVGDQIDAVLEAFAVGAIKTGMLFNAEIIECVTHCLTPLEIPVVVDPVMVATSGAALLRDDAIGALKSCLLPQATLITPNLPEASLLLGREIAPNSAADTASELADVFGCSVLVKGGHDKVGNISVDWLATDEGTIKGVKTPRIEAKTTHGTGCALSAAIAAGMAKGLNLTDAVIQAKAYIYGNLCNCRRVGDNTFAMTPAQELPLDAVEIE